MSNEHTPGSRMYPEQGRITEGDLYGLHQAAETPVADRPSDVVGINKELQSVGISGPDATSMLNKIAHYASGTSDNQKRLAAHVDADRRMRSLQHDWPEERERVAAWLRGRAPGLFNLVQNSGAGNDVGLLLELRGAFRRSRLKGD